MRGALKLSPVLPLDLESAVLYVEVLSKAGAKLIQDLVRLGFFTDDHVGGDHVDPTG